MEEEAPEAIHPAKDYWDENAKDETQNVSTIGFFHDRGDADDNLDEPVYAGNDKKNDLHQTRKAIKPFHFSCSFSLI
jgi:hypothetical protein